MNEGLVFDHSPPRMLVSGSVFVSSAPAKKGIEFGRYSFHQFPTVQTIVSKHMILGIPPSIRKAHGPGRKKGDAMLAKYPLLFVQPEAVWFHQTAGYLR